MADNERPHKRDGLLWLVLASGIALIVARILLVIGKLHGGAAGAGLVDAAVGLTTVAVVVAIVVVLLYRRS